MFLAGKQLDVERHLYGNANLIQTPVFYKAIP